MNKLRIRFVLRTVTLLLLLVIGLMAIGKGVALTDASEQFRTAENAFRGDLGLIVQPDSWGDEGSWAITTLGLEDDMKIRRALAKYRETRKLPQAEWEIYEYKRAYKEALMLLTVLSRFSDNQEITSQMATLLGVLKSEHAVARAGSEDGIEALREAVEAYEAAIRADENDEFSEDAKRNLEALYRMFAGSTSPQPSNDTGPGKGAGSADPGDGY